MLAPSLSEASLRQLPPEQLRVAAAGFLRNCANAEERISTIEAALQSRAGPLLREKMGTWIVQMLPAEVIVPKVYEQWRPLVRDAMLFTVSRLSAARLAPKLVEQIELAPDTPPEVRLLGLIAKVPGLQKLGQVLARNRHLHPALKKALSALENGISDANPEHIHAIILEELGRKLKTCSVEFAPEIFSEASVSAVVRFTWWNPDIQKRERGVFKVLKPHIPACFAEDMDLLQELTGFLAHQHREYGFAKRALPDTFSEVRRLLQHEVDFVREQTTLEEAYRLYRSVPGVRVPRLIQPLCTSNITAITEERGVKVTDAVAHMSGSQRGRVAEQLIEALIAVPLFGSEEKAMFHADPHAGNLLYDRQTEEVILLDWALTERLSRAQRRHLALLALMIGLRDATGICQQIQVLNAGAARRSTRQSRIIRECVHRFLAELPFTRLPGVVDALRLLDRIVLEGIRFPAPLLMLRKALFTLDGVLHDFGASEVRMELILARDLVQRWMTSSATFGAPLSPEDWFAVQSSALFYGSRLWLQWAGTAWDRPLHRELEDSG
jgi:ubiquinone biosynthesis protein